MVPRVGGRGDEDMEWSGGVVGGLVGWWDGSRARGGGVGGVAVGGWVAGWLARGVGVEVRWGSGQW